MLLPTRAMASQRAVCFPDTIELMTFVSSAMRFLGYVEIRANINGAPEAVYAAGTFPTLNEAQRAAEKYARCLEALLTEAAPRDSIQLVDLLESCDGICLECKLH